MLINKADPSVIAASITCPFPSLFTVFKAAHTPRASNIPPPPKSPIKFNGGGGGVSFLPIAPRTPLKAM